MCRQENLFDIGTYNTSMMFLLEVFFVFMSRLEDEVLAKVDFEREAPEFFRLLTLRQFAAVVLAADGMSQAGIAKALKVSGSTIQSRIDFARKKAVKVFGEEALESRSNPRFEYQKQERR